MSSVIVYGPQGCGKTRNKQILLDHFGLSKVKDDFAPGDKLEPDTLYLTHLECIGAINYHDIIKGS